MIVDWTDPCAEAVDGFSVEEIENMVVDSVVSARCSECKCEHSVEPDAVGYTCQNCGTENAVTSPLVKLGLI